MNRLLTLPIVILAVSCTEVGLELDDIDRIATESACHEMIVLGDKLQDPYTVENMTKALVSLYPTKAGRVTVEPTDYYVRFLPEDDTQYERLLEMGLVLIDHPLDYAVVREGDWYHDPSIPEGQVTWQYAVVPKGFTFPSGYEWEHLDDCFLPEHQSSTKSSLSIDWDAVEAESFRLTGNPSAPATKGGEICPAGRIMIEDPDFSDEPFGVSGVMVCANSFVRIGTAFTDEEGNYSMQKSFRSENVRYRLVFNNTRGFNIGLNLLLIPASVSTLGKHGPEGVSVTVNQSSDRKLFSRCVVNNAGYDWYDWCESSSSKISLPPSNLRIWLLQGLSKSAPMMFQQGAIVDASIVSDYLGEYVDLLKVFLPDVCLGLKDASDYKSIYLAATHQFAHASHFMLAGVDWWNRYEKYLLKSFALSLGRNYYGTGSGDGGSSCELAEMWAYFAQTKVARERYGDDQELYGTGWWFSPQIFLGPDERGIDRFKIFQALTDDIDDIEIFQDKLLSMYPEFKSEITQIFIRYN